MVRSDRFRVPAPEHSVLIGWAACLPDVTNGRGKGVNVRKDEDRKEGEELTAVAQEPAEGIRKEKRMRTAF